MSCLNYDISIFGSFSREELNKLYNKSYDDISIDINFFADNSPVCLSESSRRILSTISQNVDEIVFGNFPCNPQSGSSTPSSSPSKSSRTSSPQSKKSDNLSFTKQEINEWINYERINLYNKNSEYRKRYSNVPTETTLALIKEQHELYQIEKHLINIYVSTYSMIYHSIYR